MYVQMMDWKVWQGQPNPLRRYCVIYGTPDGRCSINHAERVKNKSYETELIQPKKKLVNSINRETRKSILISNCLGSDL